jgi:hypothetical protein
LIGTVDDFRAAVPLCRFEELRPQIDRMIAGEQGVLVTEPVRRFFVTSGSSSLPKYIPVTSSFVRDKWLGFQSYWKQIYRDHPELHRGVVVRNFTDAGHQRVLSSGMLCSPESSFWSAWSPGSAVSDHSPLPRAVLNIENMEARYYTIARILLETNVSAMMTLNPSTILRLFELIHSCSESLIRDIRDGGLSNNINDSVVRPYVTERYHGNPTRARQLQQLLSDQGRAFDAASVWPDLRLVICWRSVPVLPYLQLLAPYLKNVPQRDYITMASEGIIAIPFEDSVSGGALATDIHFYEFIPEEQADFPDPPTLLAHELESGRHYVVVLTTSAGLYRYVIGDVVNVSGFVGTTPILDFRYRHGNTCSLTGEKLTEDQVAGSVSHTASVFGLSLPLFVLCPVAEPFPHYVLISELPSRSDRKIMSSFLDEFDRELARRNVEYESKRASGRLGPPEFWAPSPGSFAALRNERLANGASDVQIKVACLTRDMNWYQRFTFIERISCESAA